MKVAIAANFVVEPVQAPLVFCLEKVGLPVHPHFAPFDQLVQQLLDPAGAFGGQSQLGIIFLQLERWFSTETESRTDERVMAQLFALVDALRAARSRSATTFIILLCPVSPEKRHLRAIAAAEAELRLRLGAVLDIDVVGTDEVQRFYPAEHYHALFDPYADRLAQIPYSNLGFATLGTMAARRIHCHVSQQRKVIVLDCDDTLWAGSAGEDGCAAVRVTSERAALHEFMIKQTEVGRLLCVCSKNDVSTIMRVFDRDTKMRRLRDHVVAWRINWEPKADNMRSLSEELSISLNSFIFLDNDRFECEAIRALLPEVLTLQLPTEESAFANFLKNVWVFDSKPATREDENRLLYYQQNAAREKAGADSLSMDDFIASLQLEVDFGSLRESDLPRAVQLTQRTNQFNLNGIRRTAAELLAMTQCGGRGITVSARDRFGDYGMVGLIVYSISGHSLVVETLLLSCRALGKGLERRVAAYLTNEARASAAGEIVFRYRTLPRNAPIRSFLAALGATPNAEKLFFVTLDRSEPCRHLR